MELIISSVVGLIIGGVVVFIVKRLQDESKKKSARIEAERILSRARNEAARIEKESKNRSKDFEARARKNVEGEIQKQKSKLKNQEGQLERRLKEIDDQAKQKFDEQDRISQTLKDREEKIGIAEKKIADLEKKFQLDIEELKQKISSVSSMTVEEARRELMASVEEEAKLESAKVVQNIEEETMKEAEKRAKRILATAVSRYAGEYTTERTVSVIALTSDEMKGKIIGREGRNIRTLEALCGVDLIIDDTPEAVVISSFDPVRREVARRALEKLMEDGRVHPSRIEEVVEKVRSEMNKSVKEDGEKAVLDLGIGNLHPEMVRLVGTLKYRTTNQQNCYVHSLEVAHIAGLMAAELGANVKQAKRAGLLHDIGKAVEHSVEGNHALAGAEIAKKYGETELICHAIRAHHDDEKPTDVIAHIVQAANVLSNSRPGARRPQMDNYIARLHDLESIGNSFDGVIKTFAVQAGREVRVIVESSKVTDEQSIMLSRDIARKIEREMPSIGQLKIAVVRETRAVEIAR